MLTKWSRSGRAGNNPRQGALDRLPTSGTRGCRAPRPGGVSPGDALACCATGCGPPPAVECAAGLLVYGQLPGDLRRRRRRRGPHRRCAAEGRLDSGRSIGGRPWVLSGLAPPPLADEGSVGYRAASHRGADADAVLGLWIAGRDGATRAAPPRAIAGSGAARAVSSSTSAAAAC